MLAAGGAIYGLAGTPALGFERLDITGAVLTPMDQVRQGVGLTPGTNLVALDTRPIVDRLRTLPTVDSVSVAVRLPDSLQVAIAERTPVVLWQIGSQRYAVDDTGTLFAAVGPDAPPAVAAVPVVADQRAASQGLAIASRLDPIDLDAATRLASLTPDQIGSHAAKLTVTVTDENGFTVGSGAHGWVAIFGFYGQSQRTPALIKDQVQLLAALLVGREDTIDTVVLADGHDGTYVPKPSARASASPKP